MPGKTRPAFVRNLSETGFLEEIPSGAYTVRYPFVICGFSIAETENLGTRFLLGRTLERDHFELFFLTLPFLRRTDTHIFTCFCGVRALRLIPFLAIDMGWQCQDVGLALRQARFT